MEGLAVEGMDPGEDTHHALLNDPILDIQTDIFPMVITMSGERIFCLDFRPGDWVEDVRLSNEPFREVITAEDFRDS